MVDHYPCQWLIIALIRSNKGHGLKYWSQMKKWLDVWQLVARATDQFVPRTFLPSGVTVVYVIRLSRR